GLALVTSRQKVEAGHGAVDPAEGLPRENIDHRANTDHDRAVGIHATGTFQGAHKAETDHAARGRPTDQPSASGCSAIKRRMRARNSVTSLTRCPILRISFSSRHRSASASTTHSISRNVKII